MNAAPDNSASGNQPYIRKETFLARYSRSSKLMVALGILLLLFLPMVWPKHGSVPLTPEPKVQTSAAEGPTVSPANKPGDKPAPLAPTGDAAKLDANAGTINDTDDRSARMAHVPDPGLTEDTAEGGLPRISEDGRKVWQVYARPFNTNDKRPRIAIVMVDMGLARGASDAALRRLPAPVTMAFDVQSPVVGAWLGRARQDGHETLLSLPMEPFDYPRSDPGPNALLTNLPASDNVQRLNKALHCGTGYVGITTISGSRFTTDPAKMAAVLDTLKRRGLLVFDAHVAPHSTLNDLAKQKQVPVAVATLQIDRDSSPHAIDAALNQLEQAAHLTGHAIGVASPLPVTLDHLEKWIKQLPDHGLALAPVSAVVE